MRIFYLFIIDMIGFWQTNEFPNLCKFFYLREKKNIHVILQGLSVENIKIVFYKEIRDHKTMHENIKFVEIIGLHLYNLNWV